MVDDRREAEERRRSADVLQVPEQERKHQSTCGPASSRYTLSVSRPGSPRGRNSRLGLETKVSGQVLGRDFGLDFDMEAQI